MMFGRRPEQQGFRVCEALRWSVSDVRRAEACGTGVVWAATEEGPRRGQKWVRGVAGRRDRQKSALKSGSF